MNIPEGTTHFKPSNKSFWCKSDLLGLHYWSTAKECWRKAYTIQNELTPINEAFLIENPNYTFSENHVECAYVEQ